MIAGLGPVRDQAVDDDMADAIGGIERRKIRAVLADFRFGEAFGCSDTDGLLVVVGGCAKDKDAIDVELIRVGEPGE